MNVIFKNGFVRVVNCPNEWMVRATLGYLHEGNPVCIDLYLEKSTKKHGAPLFFDIRSRIGSVLLSHAKRKVHNLAILKALELEFILMDNTDIYKIDDKHVGKHTTWMLQHGKFVQVSGINAVASYWEETGNARELLLLMAMSNGSIFPPALVIYMQGGELTSYQEEYRHVPVK